MVFTHHLVLLKTEGPLFYLNPPKPLPELDDKQDLQDAIAKGERLKWMIVLGATCPKLETPTTIELSEASYPWETDYNFRNKVVLVRLGNWTGYI